MGRDGKWVRRKERNRNIPLALAIDFVLAKGDVLELALTIGLLNPTTDVIISVPPVEVRDHECRGRTRVNRTLIRTLFALDTLLGALGGGGTMIARVVHVVLIVVVVMSVILMGLALVLGIAMGLVVFVSVLATGIRAVDVDLKLLVGHCDVVKGVAFWGPDGISSP